jgi:uroporphyrinogen-III decarboxylase
VISIGHEVDLDAAAEAFPGCVIAGNLDPTTIARISDDDLMANCKRIIERGKQLKNGFIFMAGCEVPPNTPIEKVHIMREAIDKYGWY